MQVKNERITVRTTAQEKKEFTALAEYYRNDLSSYIRDKLRQEYQRLLDEGLLKPVKRVKGKR